MTPDRWQQISQVYHDALMRDAPARAGFLREMCAGDDALYREVASLLANESQAAGFLSEPAFASAARTVHDSGGTMLIGRRFGVYHIQMLLGAGGMGEVYRARDTKLGRDVAFKILPHVFTADPDRLVRFEREARVLAALNHPHIGAIYGVEDADGIRALVLELVEGKTLAEKLSGPRLPVADTLAMAGQIADALDAAHEKGIIHRDLKPANVKITSDGVVKVLDFGLAKLSPAADAGSEASTDTRAPTVTPGGTREGVVLGTAAYMSPEQARGRPVDKRTDIWAFGCVLYEMLAGQPAFARETVTDTLAAVIEHEPDWTTLPATTPTNVRRLLTRCLEKDSKRRLRDIGDACLEISEALVSLSLGNDDVKASVHRAAEWGRMAIALAGVAAIAGAAVWFAMRPAPPAALAVSRMVMAIPPSLPFLPTLKRNVAISADGTRFAYASAQGWVVRSRDRLDGVLLPVPPRSFPFFSPDGQWIGYDDGPSLMKLAVAGGSPVAIASTGGGTVGSWGADGIVFADVNGLFSVSSDGGTPEKLKMQELAPGEQAAFPELLPGGETLLFTVIPTRTATVQLQLAADAAGARIEALDLRTGTRKVLVRGGGAARYVPGHLVYAARGTLYAIAFDIDRVAVRSDPVQVAAEPGSSDFAVSSEGSLVYVSSANTNRTLVWVDRRGLEEPLEAPARTYVYPRLSPDDTRVALVVAGAQGSGRDIWIWEFQRKLLEIFTVDPSDNPTVAWSPDGTRVAFGSARVGGVPNVFWQAADGSGAPERLLESSRFGVPLSFPPDGRLLVGAPGQPVLALSLDGTRRTERILENGYGATVSPDGRWIAYDSAESGQQLEVYVRPYPDADRRRWRISTGGGRQPLWSRDGRELFYRNFAGDVMAVRVALAPTFVPGASVMLISGAGYTGDGSGGSAQMYDVSKDGRFLMIKKANVADPSLIVVVNWFEELKQLVPTKR